MKKDAHPKSHIKAHVLAMISIMTIFVAINFSVVLWKQVSLFEDTQMQSLDGNLYTVQDAFLSNLSTAIEGNILSIPPMCDPRFTRPYSGFYHAVVDENGMSYAKSTSLLEQNMPMADAPLFGNLQTAELGSERVIEGEDKNGQKLRILATVILTSLT